MKTEILAAVLISAGLVFAGDTNYTVSVTAALKDGSTIKGELATPMFTGKTLFANNLALDAQLVKSIAVTGKSGESKIELSNGDTFALTLANPNIDIDSSLGKLNIPLSNIRSLSLDKRMISCGGDAGLVLHCTFDSKESIPGRINNAEFTEGKVGNGMLVKRGLSACEIALPKRAIGHKGCIEFWASMIDGKTEFTTGGDPQFFNLFDAKGRILGAMGYASNDGMGNGGICARLPFGNTYSNRGFCQMMPYSKIFHGEPYEGWHHYALVWNCDGLVLPDANGRRIAILIDGKIATPHENIGVPQESQIDFDAITLFAIPMRYDDPSYINKSNILIDELKIWNYDKTEFQL